MLLRTLLLLLSLLLAGPSSFAQRAKSRKPPKKAKTTKAAPAAKAPKITKTRKAIPPPPPAADTLPAPGLLPVERLPAVVDAAAPAGYFTFPIKPGERNFLAGSMGEIRPNHFHGGIDIKTDGRTGLPVYAAADGFVARAKASAYGYGNVVYLQHANGLVTVYGHLERFAPKLAAVMKREQYRRETFECEITSDKPVVSFRQGEVLGYSGNTGGSGGPHLHFEVRDKMERVLNPLAFGGYPEIADNVPPVVAAFAVRPLGITARVGREFRRAEFRVKKLDATHYVVPDTIRAAGWVGLELAMFDRFSRADNHNGVQQLAATVNGQPLLRYVLDEVPFAQQRMVSCHINYEVFKRTGNNFQKCYVDDGNALAFYTAGPAGDRGRLRVLPGRTYAVAIRVADSYGNTTEVRATLRGEAVGYWSQASRVLTPRRRLDATPDENVLVVRAPFVIGAAADSGRIAVPRPLGLFVGQTRYDLRASYATRGEAVYLYDLRGGLPDSIVTADSRLRLRNLFQAVVPSASERAISLPALTLVTESITLFDTLYVKAAFDSAGVWTLNSPLTPLFKPLRLTLRPATPPADRARTAVYGLLGKRASYEGGTWSADGAEVSFTTKALGRYVLLADTVAPKARLVKKNAKEVRFTIADNLSGIAGWRCEVGGKWLLLHYEYKTATLFSEQLDPAVPLKGPIRFTVKDAMGNETVVEGEI